MDNMIETSELTKLYPDGTVGIQKLSLTIKEGEIFGFLGSNGAGKTTTIRLLVNLIFPTSGRARIMGKDIVKDHMEICREIGYLPSSIRPHKHMSGKDFLDYMGKFFPTPIAGNRQRLLERFEFSQKDLKRPIKHYSSGMARKIALVSAFQHNPRLVFMDEPTEGLDPVMQHSFYELLKEYRDQGGTVFISSHHLREVEQVCDGAAIIRKGELVAHERVRNLVHNMSRTLQVRFKHPVKQTQLNCEDWQITALNTKSLSARVTGDINKVLAFLTGFELDDLTLPPLSLEDVFLSYYSEEEK